MTMPHYIPVGIQQHHLRFLRVRHIKVFLPQLGILRQHHAALLFSARHAFAHAALDHAPQDSRCALQHGDLVHIHAGERCIAPNRLPPVAACDTAIVAEACYQHRHVPAHRLRQHNLFSTQRIPRGRWHSRRPLRLQDRAGPSRAPHYTNCNEEYPHETSAQHATRRRVANMPQPVQVTRGNTPHRSAAPHHLPAVRNCTVQRECPLPRIIARQG